MFDGGAERQTEKSERSLIVGGGTAEGRGTVRQTDTARDGHVGDGALAPEPQVLPVNRRIGNGTSGGVGGRGREAPPYPIRRKRFSSTVIRLISAGWLPHAHGSVVGLSLSSAAGSGVAQPHTSDENPPSCVPLLGEDIFSLQLLGT